MKLKHYWVYADGETVKELTEEEYRKRVIKCFKEDCIHHLYATVWDTELHFMRGRHGFTIRRKQLERLKP